MGTPQVLLLRISIGHCDAITTHWHRREQGTKDKMPSRHQKRFNHAGQHVVIWNSETLSCPAARGPGHQRLINSKQTLPPRTSTAWQGWDLRPLVTKESGP